MAAATILHVGDDFCYRIPLMERAGLRAIKTECSISALESALADGQTYLGIAFHNEAHSPLNDLAETARDLSAAPRILFENSLVDCDERLFDLVVPVQTPPGVWLKSLEETIFTARGLRRASERLLEECAGVLEFSRSLRRIAAQNRKSPFDYDALWRDNPE